MADDTVISLSAERALKRNDGSWSPEEMLTKVAADIRSGAVSVNKAVVLLLDDEDDGYGVARYTAQIRPSETIALMEFAKAQTIADMEG